MKTPRDTRETLKRYFLNASPFLWGVLDARKKKERIIELKELGFLEDCPENTKKTYELLNQELLVEAGIVVIIDRIVVPLVQRRIGHEALKYFRRCWEVGQLPDKKYLKDASLYRQRRATLAEHWEENRIVPEKDPAFIFLDINEALDFVDRWTVFAGIWFEIIEPGVIAGKGDE